MACALLVSCSTGDRVPSDDELSTFGKYVYALDTVRMEQSLKHILSADTSHWVFDMALRKRYADISKFEDTPLWYSRMGVIGEADSLLAFLRRNLPQSGLDTTAFFLPEIAKDLGIVRSLAFDSVGQDINDLLPRLDYHLSKAYVRYAVGQRYGFVRPTRLMNKLFKRADSDDFARLFDEDVKEPNCEEALAQLASGGRLEYLTASMPNNSLYKTLQHELTSVTGKEARRRLAVNMERCRWQMSRPDDHEKVVLVNIPAQQLWAVSTDSVFDMRICCGATATKSPLLHSSISHVQVNPDWIIPQNIVRSDILRHAGDTAYFARHHYYIVDQRSGDSLDVADVTSDQLASGTLRVGQHGGPGNSLGRIVFRFNNNFSVYLHDTNNRGAFNRERRTLSHGCIRVEKPFDLARFLLPDLDEWDLDRLRISMDLPPESDQGKEYLEENAEEPRPFRLMTYHDVTPRVPVYIIYYTAYPNPATGIVQTWPDLYGYDKAIASAIECFLPK
jgi:hypothetical protein